MIANIRLIFHGTRVWREKFGRKGRNEEFLHTKRETNRGRFISLFLVRTQKMPL